MNVAVALTGQDLVSPVLSEVAANVDRVKAATGGVAGGFLEAADGADRAAAAMGTLNLTVNNFARGAGEATGAAAGMRGALAEVGTSAEAAKAESEGLLGTFKDIGSEAAGLALGIIGIQAGVGIFENLKNVVVEYNENLDLARIGLASFVGQAGAASDIAQIQGLGATTPFATDALLQAGERLASLGVSAEQIPIELRDIAAAAAEAGKGSEAIGGIAQALARVQETGVVNTQIVRAFATEGVDAYKIVEEASGETAAQVKEDFKKGKISADDFLADFHAFENEHGAEALQARVDTLGGSLQVVSNEGLRVEAEAFRPLDDRLTLMANHARDFITSADFRAWGASVSGGLETVLGLLDGIDPKLIGIAATMGASVLAANLITVAYGGLAAAGTRLAASDLVTTLGLLGSDAGALEGVGGAIGVVGDAALAALGPVGLLALGVGTFALAYQTDFLGTRDVTDAVVARVVDDAGIWVRALDDVATAASRIQLPQISLPSLPGIPNASGLLSGLALTVPEVGPIVNAIQVVDSLTQSYGRLMDAEDKASGKAAGDAAAEMDRANALADQKRQTDALANTANTRVVYGQQAGATSAAFGTAGLAVTDAILSITTAEADYVTRTENAKKAVDAWTPTLQRSRDDLERQKVAAEDAKGGVDAYRSAVEAATLATDQHAASLRAAATVESALGGAATLAQDFIAADPAAAAYDNQIQGIQDHIQQLRDQASQTGQALKASVEDAIPGLKAFDAATFGLSQKLAGVQLAVEQRKLARMEAAPATTPQREARVLQEEMTVRGLERQTEFGSAINAYQQQQQAQKTTTTGDSAAIRALNDQVKALQAAKTDEAKIRAAEAKFFIDQKPKIDADGTQAQADAAPLLAFWASFEANKAKIASESPDQAAADYKSLLTQLAQINDEVIVGQMKTEGKEIPTVYHQIGTDAAKNLVAGVTDKLPDVTASGTQLGKTLLDGVLVGLQGLGAGTGGTAKTLSGPLADQITQAATGEGIDPGIFQRLVQNESGGNQGARSPTGAIGLTQLEPDTAKGLGVDPYDAQQNLQGGAKFLREMLDEFGGDYRKAIEAYNAGPGNIQNGIVPPETLAYMQRVYGSGPASTAVAPDMVRQQDIAGAHADRAQRDANGAIQTSEAAAARYRAAAHAAGLPGYADGGSFQVGGSGGTDSQLVAFYASPDERVRVDTPSQQRGGGLSIGSLFGSLTVAAGVTKDDLKRASSEAIDRDWEKFEAALGRGSGRAQRSLSGAWG